jgi:hypothetical protein
LKEKLVETLSFRVSGAVYEALTSIAKSDRRKLSEVAQALLERGLIAYKRDGAIFEVESQTVAVYKADAVEPPTSHAPKSAPANKTVAELRKRH